MSQDILLKVNMKKFTIEVSEARKVQHDAVAGHYFLLGKVYRPDIDEWVDARLLIVPDGGYSN